MNGIVNIKRNITGNVQVKHSITGKIDKPSHQTSDGDHQFIVVDLVKMHEQITSVSNATAIVPFTAQTSQVLNQVIEIHAVPTTVSVNRVTANNISFTSSNTTVNQVTATVNEEVYNNANE